MKVGLALLPKLPLAELGALAADAEAAGVASLWVPDERFFRDVFVTLSVVAGRTRRVRIATGITDPYIRHPLLTATAIASIDELAEGRAILGLGAGVSGFEALGIVREAPARAMREAVDLCRAFWGGESVTREGRFAVRKAQLQFPSRAIPVYITGRGRRVLALGGEVADGVVIGHFTSAEGIGHARRSIGEGLERRAPGASPPEIAVWAYTSVSADGQAARDAVKPAIGRTIASTPEVLSLLGVDAPALLAELGRFGYARGEAYDAAMRAAVPEVLTRHLSIAGTPEECIEQIAGIEAAGVDHVIFLPYPAAGMGMRETVEMLMDEVACRVA